MRKLAGFVLFAAICFNAGAQSEDAPPWKLYYDSTQFFWGKDWPKTVSLLKNAERSALNDLGLYDPNYLTIVNDLGLAYWQLKDYTTAEKLLNKSLGLKKEIYPPGDPELLGSFSNLAALYTELGNLPKAKQLYKQVLSSPAAKNDDNAYWNACKNLALLYEAYDQADSALLLMESPRLNSARNTDNNILLSYEIDLAKGRINRKLGRYEEAKAILDPVVRNLATQREPAISALYIRSLQESGLLYLETGSFDKAEKNLLQGFRLLKEEQPSNVVLLTELLNTIASVYEKLSIFDKAMAYYQESLNVCRQLHGANSLPCTTLQSNIAGVYLKQGFTQKAIPLYEEVLKNLKGTVPESNPLFITILNNLATAYRKNKQYTQASAHIDQALRLIQQNKMEKDDLAATVMNNMAVLLTAQGQPDKAVGYYEKAYEIRKMLYGDQSVLLMNLSSNLAVVHWAMQKPEKALPLFQRSIDLAIKQIRYIFPNLSEGEQIQFYQKLKEDFERFNTIAFQSAASRPELLVQVFNNQITIKSLLFFTQQHRNATVQAQHDTVLSRQYELLKSKRKQLGYLYQLSLKELAGAEVSVTALEKEIDALEKAISLRTSETVAEKMITQQPQWSDIQTKLQPDEALLELIRFRKYDWKTFLEGDADRISFGFTDSVYYAALITTTATVKAPQLVLMKEGANMETRFFNYYKNALRFSIPDVNTYPFYWKPFEAAIGKRTKIYFSNDGVYNKINVGTIRNPSTGEFVLQRYDVHYLLNPAQFLEKRKNSFTTHRSVLMGDPVFDMELSGTSRARNQDDRKFASLPGSHTEVVNIHEILKSKGWTSEVFLKKTATEQNLKNVHAPGILHIATHGFFSTDRVRLSENVKKDFLFHSGLILSGANKNLEEATEPFHDDGIVTAYEVMNLDLAGTDLVVLSACETGLGKIENGEGVYGLQRSFLQAGARNILISLWKVDDQVTQELMIKFYQYLFKGKPFREALKAAQLDQLHKANNPANWGGFVMVGVD